MELYAKQSKAAEVRESRKHAGLINDPKVNSYTEHVASFTIMHNYFPVCIFEKLKYSFRQNTRFAPN